MRTWAPPRSPTSRFSDPGRTLATLLCALFGAIGVVPFTIGLLVRFPSVQAWASRETATVLERELGVVARYRVELSVWPLSVGLSGVTVDGSDGLGPALEAARIGVRPRLFSLLSGRIDAGDVEIDAPRVRLVVRGGALENVRYHLPKAPTDARTSLRPPFHSIAVTDGALDLDLDGARLRGGDLDVDVSAEDGPIFEVALRAGQQSVVRARPLLSLAPGVTDGIAVDEDSLCHLDARLRLARGSVLVRRLLLDAVADLEPGSATAPSCALPGADARRLELELGHVQLTMPETGAPEVDGAIHLRVPLGLVNRFVKFPELRGYVSVDLSGRYAATSALPALQGTITGAGIELDQYRLMRELSADVTLENDVVRSKRASVGFADGTIVLQNLAIEPLKKGAPIRIGATDATNAHFAAMMRDLGVTPHAHVNWTYRSTHVGSMEGTLAPLRLDAEFSGSTGDFEVFDRAVDDPDRRHMIGVKEARVSGHVSIRDDAVVFRGAHIDFADSHLETTVSLGFHNDIALTVAPSSRLDLATISPLATLKMAGRAIVGVEMSGKFNDPVLTGELAVSGLALDDFPLGDVASSKVRFRPLVVDFSDLHAKKGTSSFEVPSARLDFEGPATLVADAAVEAASLSVRDFLHMWHFDTDPRFDEVNGRGATSAAVHYELGGPGDACGGGSLLVRGKTRMSSLDLFEEHYDELDAEFVYRWLDRDAADLGLDVDLRAFTLRKGRGSIFGSGTLRRGGRVRAELVADDIPLARIQAMGALGKLLEGSISGAGTVSGTLDQLEADVDLKMSPVRIGGAVLPASRLRVALAPRRGAPHVLGRTRCGQPITAPFDRAEFERDVPQGMFHASGQLFGGQVAFDDLAITRQRRKTAAGEVSLTGLDLSALGGLRSAPAGGAGPADGTAAQLSGTLSAALSIAALPLDAPERARATVKLTELDLGSRAGRLALRSAPPTLTIGDDRLRLPPLDLELRTAGGFRGVVHVAGELRRLAESPEVDLSIEVPPTELSSLAPLSARVERANGTFAASLAATGRASSPVYSGQVRLRDGELSLRGLPMPLSAVNVDLSVGGGEVRVARGEGTLGGGRFSISGRAPIHGFKLGDVSGSVVARGVGVPALDGVAMTCDADLRAEWKEKAGDDDEPSLPRVSGELVLTSFTYTRPIGVGTADIGALAQRDRRKTFVAYDPADDAIAFDVRLRARDPLRLRNDLVDAQLVVDSDALAFAGTNQRYGLRGRMRLLPGGRIRLRANEFEVRQGFVRFDDPTRIAPHVDVTAVTDYRRYSAVASGPAPAAGAVSASTPGRAGGVYRITLHAYGDADNLRLDMTSEPALSQEDILLLLTIGMTRAEVDQLQASNIGGTVALEALSSLTGANTVLKRAVPVIDDFRFGSAYSSKTGRTEATVTLGKRVTDQVRANVTSGLSDNREIRSNLEWKLTPRVSVQGSYDNVNDVSSSALGNLGADVRFRLEFE